MNSDTGFDLNDFCRKKFVRHVILCRTLPLLQNLIQSAVDGYNVCLFAYEQSGSGKTYTMIRGKDSKGVIQRVYC